MTEPNDPHQKQTEPPAGQGGFPAAPAPGGYPPAPPTTQGYGEYGAPGQAPLPAGTDLATAGKRIGTALLEIPLAIVTLGIGYLIWQSWQTFSVEAMYCGLVVTAFLGFCAQLLLDTMQRLVIPWKPELH